MAKRRINPRLIKLHRPYSVEEAARALGAHKNTVRGWIKAGLPIIDDRRPVLILGNELRRFLEGRRKSARCPSPLGYFFCFRCRESRLPAAGMVDYVARNGASGNLTALCDTCGTVMNRRARLVSLPDIMPNLVVQIREAEPRLVGRAAPSPNCDKGKD
jgi:excisionase family DNA binding protein